MIYLISQIHSQSDQTENDLAYNIISGFKIQFNAINSIQFMSKQVKSILCELNSTTIITTTNTTTTYYLLPTTTTSIPRMGRYLPYNVETLAGDHTPCRTPGFSFKLLKNPNGVRMTAGFQCL
jgi:hypothetical protein